MGLSLADMALSSTTIARTRMAGFYRGWFRSKGNPDYSLTIDLAIRSDGKISGLLAMNGWWGRLGSNDVWPFVLQSKGEMDFGNDSNQPTPDNERYAHFDIHQKPISGDQTYHLEWNGEHYDFVIHDLKDFAEFEMWPELKAKTNL
jgi:hypothetical protein